MTRASPSSSLHAFYAGKLQTLPKSIRDDRILPRMDDWEAFPNGDDTRIGQRVEELAAQVDYLCPMVYPSGYHLGMPGFPTPVAHPYEVVRETISRIRRRSAQTPARIRPWVQDFRDYAFDRRPFGVAEIRAQIRGATEAGAVGWMLWNPRNDYTEEALGPEPGRVPPPAR